MPVPCGSSRRLPEGARRIARMTPRTNEHPAMTSDDVDVDVGAWQTVA